MNELPVKRESSEIKMSSVLAVVVGFIVYNTVRMVYKLGYSEFSGATTVSDNAILGSVVWDMGAAFAGGYICAWIAQQQRMKHVGMLCMIIFIIGVLSVVMAANAPTQVPEPLWVRIVGPMTSMAAAAAGGYLRAR